MKYIEIFLGALIIWIVEYFAGKILFEYKEKHVLRMILIILLSSVLLSIINIMNFEILNGIVKILSVYFLQTFFFKFMFNKSLSKSMITALIWYLCTFFSEFFVILIASIITNILDISMEFMKQNIFLSPLIVLLSLCIVKFFKNKFKKMLSSDIVVKVNYIVINMLILITLSLLAFKIPLKNWSFNSEFVFILLIILCFSIVGIYLIKQKSDIEKVTSEYQKLAKYSNTTNKVLEDYRMINHEHQNQLSIIRQMANKKNKALIEYVDNLLDKKNDIKYKWVTDLSFLPLEGLKGLINYKLIEMEENKINPVVIISKEISKFKLERMNTIQKDNIYSVVGVYLDNAMDAAKESKKKEVNIEIYKDRKDLVIIIANTYKGKINSDKLDEYGYTTKGKNHGVGLHLVKGILENNKLLTHERKIVEDYYIEELRIHVNRIKK